MSNQSGGLNSDSLYKRQEKIYPREVKGFFQRLRKLSMLVLLGIYYGLAWLNWDGRQAVLFDLPERKFHIFGLTLWPQDFFFLALLLIMAGLSLFFFTALAGRLWCGYACPQTVWTEAFLWMERLVEGNRRQQMALAKSTWTREKIIRTGLKQFLWVSFALWTGFTFVGYFTPIRELGAAILSFSLGPWETFWVIFYSFATYGNAGFLREQVCLYMCPYARFQSAMFDKDTLIIGYDEERGEPRTRGKKRKTDSGETAGDCIDCGLCVQVCPTGIDIRNGLQYECIACAACIDVCNEVMVKVEKPINLIHYTTDNIKENKAALSLKRVLRPRTIIYGVLLATLFIAFTVALLSRAPIAVDILRDRNTLYQVEDNRSIKNTYTVKIMNKSNSDQVYSITVPEFPNALINAPNHIAVPASTLESVEIAVTLPLSDLKSSNMRIHLEVTETQSESPYSVSQETRFLSPGV